MTHAEACERRREMALAAENGLTTGQVAEKFGVNYTTANRALMVYGVTSRLIKKDTYKIISALINTDRLLTEIAAAAGVSSQRIGQVYQRCIEAGIPVRIRAIGRQRRKPCT